VHVADEYAAIVNNNLLFYELETADIGEVVNIKAVTSGQSVDIAPVSSFTFAPLSAYTITNASVDRTYNADATTLDEISDVVATVIDDENL
jgi:hypothetical protein